MPGALRIESVGAHPVGIRLGDALVEAALKHLGEGAETPVGAPIPDEPVQIKRAAGKPPQIGSLDLVKQRIKVRGAMGGGEDPHALGVQRRHKHDQRLLGYWFPIPPPLFAPKGPDQELVGCRRWRKARIPRDRQPFAQLGQVSRGVPIRHATRERHMRAAFATDDALGNPPDGAIQPHSPELRLINRIDEEPCRLVRGAPVLQPPPVPDRQRALEAIRRDILDRGEKRELSSLDAPSSLLPHFLGFAGAGFGQNDQAAAFRDVRPIREVSGPPEAEDSVGVRILELFAPPQKSPVERYSWQEDPPYFHQRWGRRASRHSKIEINRAAARRAPLSGRLPPRYRIFPRQVKS